MNACICWVLSNENLYTPSLKEVEVIMLTGLHFCTWYNLNSIYMLHIHVHVCAYTCVYVHVPIGQQEGIYRASF